MISSEYKITFEENKKQQKIQSQKTKPIIISKNTTIIKFKNYEGNERSMQYLQLLKFFKL